MGGSICRVTWTSQLMICNKVRVASRPISSKGWAMVVSGGVDCSARKGCRRIR
jgi:hypothetical protein